MCERGHHEDLPSRQDRVDITANMVNGRREKFTLLDLGNPSNRKLKVLFERSSRYERDFRDDVQ